MASDSQGQEIAVLLAERRAAARTSLCELLSRQGYRVFDASDSTTSIELMIAHPEIAALLVDVCIPDWLSIVNHARSNIRHAVVLTMSYDGIPKISNGKPLGIDHCFTKPLLFSEIKDTMERLLASRPVHKR